MHSDASTTIVSNDAATHILRVEHKKRNEPKNVDNIQLITISVITKVIERSKT